MTSVFERMCPYYLMYGMTYEQYWYGDPWALVSYREAFNIRNRQRNEEMWLQGVYNLHAFSTVLSNAFRKKGATEKKYLQKPLDIYPKSEAEKAEEAERERKKIIASLTAWGKDFARRHPEQGVQTEA